MSPKEELDNEEETSEVEDHSSDESEEEEVTSEEETSDNSKEEEADHSSEDEDASLDKFIDPKDAAANKEVHKRMFAGYTKAVQKLKKEYNQLEDALGTRYSQALIKAKALDNLSENNDFKLFIEDARNGKPYGHSSAYNRGKSRDDDEEDDADEPSKKRNGAGGLTAAQVAKIVQGEVNKALKPFQSRFAQDDYAAVIKEFPDFNRYKADITAILQENPNMSVRAAYKAAAFDDKTRRRNADDEEDDIRTREKLKKKPRSEKPSSKTTGPLSPPTVKTVKDAIEFALSKQE